MRLAGYNHRIILLLTGWPHYMRSRHRTSLLDNAGLDQNDWWELDLFFTVNISPTILFLNNMFTVSPTSEKSKSWFFSHFVYRLIAYCIVKNIGIGGPYSFSFSSRYYVVWTQLFCRIVRLTNQTSFCSDFTIKRENKNILWSRHLKIF